MIDAKYGSDAIEAVAILAPTPSDARICQEILQQANIAVHLCCDTMELCQAIRAGTGVGIVPDMFLDEPNFETLRDSLRSQPDWSDFPLLILLGKVPLSSQRVEQLLSLGNVTLIPCPLRISIFLSTLQAQLRDRKRQVVVRNLIEERRRAAELAAIDSRRLRMALHAGEMGAWEWSATEIYWSPQFYYLLGLDPTIEPELQSLYERVHMEDRDELSRRWFQSLSDSIDFEIEFRIHHPVLGMRWISAIGEPVRDSHGGALRHSGVVQDVTQRHKTEDSLKAAREQADAANRSKSEFIANMSHEIRTPMTAILGYVELLGEMATSDEARDYVVTIRRNGLYLLEIINDILDLSKIEADKIELFRELFCPVRLVEDVQSIMTVRATENKISLNIDYSSGMPKAIYADPKRLKQVLINLVGNAIKFTDQGAVTLSARYEKSANRLFFKVSDTGIGMTERQIGQLFQPFTQVDSSESRRFEGTGLGLAISKRLVTMMGGEISVESEPGVGSCFIAEIDCGDLSHAGDLPVQLLSEPEGSPVQWTPQSLNCRVLVVDDRRDIRFLAARLLTKAGASITEAEDGLQAVQMVEDMLHSGQVVDLILLDMQMPRLDGYRTAERLRRLGFAGPIVALTADAMQGDMSRCLKCGCNNYLSKPIDQAMLLDMVYRLTAS